MPSSPTLSARQLRALDDDGFLAPLTFCSPDRMAELRQGLDAVLHSRRGPFHGDPWSARHQDCRLVYDICAADPICAAVEAVLGPDLVVWNSVFFTKEPGGAAIPWHQDRDFMLLDPDVGLSVWLAIDDATIGNGCVQVVPGSHRVLLEHRPRTEPEAFDASVDTAAVATEAAVPVELRAGQFLLLRPSILHSSAPNPSQRRRMGLAVRFTVPGVRIRTEELFDGYRVYPVRGRGGPQVNPVGLPPAA